MERNVSSGSACCKTQRQGVIRIRHRTGPLDLEDATKRTVLTDFQEAVALEEREYSPSLGLLPHFHPVSL